MTEKMTAVQGKQGHKEHAPAQAPAQHHAPAEQKKEEHKHTETKHEPATEQKKEQKPEVKKIPKKEEAVARGVSLAASKKHCMYICRFIKNKPIDQSLKELQEVIAMKRAIPFKGEIPHRRQPGIMSGRYPVKASQQFVAILKALRGNVLVNGLDLDKTRIYFASANWASRPQRRGGVRFKRTHVVLKAKEVQMKEAKK